MMTAETSIKIRLTKNGAKMPRYASAGASGADLHACILTPVTVHPNERSLIPCGFAIELPDGLEAQVRPRSGLALKHGITIQNSPGTIDSDYRGEVFVMLRNEGSEPFVVNYGDRIAQMVIVPVLQYLFEEVDEVSATVRGAGGFGSTGVTSC